MMIRFSTTSGVLALLLGLLFSVTAVGPLHSQSLEVIPAKVRVEAGGAASQVLVQGGGAEAISKFAATLNSSPSPYLLVKKGGEVAGRRTLVLLARPDAPRDRVFGLSGDGTELPLRITVVEPGEGTSIETGDSAQRDIREAIREAEGGRVVVSANQAPVVKRTIPSPLRIPPNGETQTIILVGERLDTISDVRVREATAEPRYRGKRGKLPFRYRDGRLEIDVVASRNTELGKEYAIDLMVQRFRAWTGKFVIGQPVEIPRISDSEEEGPLVIELPPEASQGTEN